MIAFIRRRAPSRSRRPRRSSSRYRPGFELSAGVIDFTEAPFSQVTYAYPCRPASRVSLAGLPEPMRDELLWWLWSLHAGGERVNSWMLQLWVRVAVALTVEPKRPVDSFVCVSVEEWMHVARRQFYERRGRLPGRTFEQTHRATIARLCAALVRAYGTGDWWRTDVWDPRRDPRIPVREHEPLGNARLRFAEIEQAWLREAIKWFFASALERGMLAWSSLPGYRTYLGGYFSEFLLGAGIDDPRLADCEAELRGVALAFLSHLRGRRSRRGAGPLSLVSVGLSQSAVASFYLFMADHRHEAAKALGEPRWSELSDAHARLWRAGEFVRRDRRAGPTDYIEPEALGRIVSHLDILALGRDQTKTVMVDGERREIAGRGDPQAMRAFLLEVLTGRRINEILLIDPEPLSPLPGIDAGAEHDPEAFVARLRYRQSKIAGAPDTILVEREVVNIISEQQRWLREHLAGARAGLAAGAAVSVHRLAVQSPRRAALQRQHAADPAARACHRAPDPRRARPAGRLSAHPPDAPHQGDRAAQRRRADPRRAALSRPSLPGDDDALRRHATQDSRARVSALQEARRATAASWVLTRPTSTRWCSSRVTPTGSCPTGCACCRRSSAASAATHA